MEKLRKQIYDVLNKHDREVNIFGAVTNDEVSNLVDDLVKLLAIPDVSPRFIYFECQYTGIECDKYDSGSSTLLTQCSECEHYKQS